MIMDPYKVLGLPPTATADEVKKRYRQLAFETHPDRNPGNKAAEAKFKEFTEAYEKITNPPKQDPLFGGFNPFGGGGFTGGGGFSFQFKMAGGRPQPSPPPPHG